MSSDNKNGAGQQQQQQQSNDSRVQDPNDQKFKLTLPVITIENVAFIENLNQFMKSGTKDSSEKFLRGLAQSAEARIASTGNPIERQKAVATADTFQALFAKLHPEERKGEAYLEMVDKVNSDKMNALFGITAPAAPGRPPGGPHHQERRQAPLSAHAPPPRAAARKASAEISASYQDGKRGKAKPTTLSDSDGSDSDYEETEEADDVPRKKSKGRKEGASSFVDENPKGSKRLRTAREGQESKSGGDSTRMNEDKDEAQESKLGGGTTSSSNNKADWRQHEQEQGDDGGTKESKEKTKDEKEKQAKAKQLRHIKKLQSSNDPIISAFIKTADPLKVHFQPKSGQSSQPASFSVRLRNPSLLAAFPEYAIGFGGPDDPPKYAHLQIYPNLISGATQHPLPDKMDKRDTTVYIYPVAAGTKRPTGFPVTIQLAADDTDSNMLQDEHPEPVYPSHDEITTWMSVATDMLRLELYGKDGQYITPAESDKRTKMGDYQTWADRQPRLAGRKLPNPNRLHGWYTQVALPHAQAMSKRAGRAEPQQPLPRVVVPVPSPDSLHSPIAVPAASAAWPAQVSFDRYKFTDDRLFYVSQ